MLAKARGKSMLAQAEMLVVIALAEINNARHAGVRDGRVRPKGNYGGALESATVTKFIGNYKVERGKPHKRETQIW